MRLFVEPMNATVVDVDSDGRVNIENEGSILGYWRAEAGTYFLDKHNVSEFATVKLPHQSEWRVIGVVTLVQSRVRRQDRPTPRR